MTFFLIVFYRRYIVQYAILGVFLFCSRKGQAQCNDYTVIGSIQCERAPRAKTVILRLVVLKWLFSTEMLNTVLRYIFEYP